MAEKQSLVDVIIHVNTTKDLKDALEMFNELARTNPAPIEKMQDLQKESKKESINTKKEPEKEPEKESKKESKKEEENTEAEVSINDIKKTMSDVVKAGKRSEAKALLEEFGASKVSSLSEDQYSGFFEKLNKLL